MKTIIGVVILSLFTLSAIAAPKRNPNHVDIDNDQRFLCKNSESDLMYVVNVTDGIIKTYVNDHDPANGIPKELNEMTGLVVNKETETVLRTRKKIVTYTLSKKISASFSSKEILRPIAELEMETASDSSKVVVAEMKIMDVKPNDDNDIELNMHCKGTKKE